MNSMATSSVSESLALLRAIVGYLGEKERHNWWATSFFAVGSHAFLSPIFPRTRVLAQCSGVSQAALLLHDERIGVGRVHHLFRLPEDMEQDIFLAWQNPDLTARIDAELADPDQAIRTLRSMAAPVDEDAIGPVRVGQSDDLINPTAWSTVAGLYALAFEQSRQIYPYFVDIGA